MPSYVHAKGFHSGKVVFSEGTMSSDVALQRIFKKAKEAEAQYDWSEAARSYEQALQKESKTIPLAEMQERIGICYCRASKQAETPSRFKKLRQLTVEAYVGAADLFDQGDSLTNQGKSAECRALAAYARAWLASEPQQRRKDLDECCTFGRKGLDAYEKAGNELQYGRLCSALSQCLLERLYVASDWEEMTNVAQKGIDCSSKSIRVFSRSGEKAELLLAHSLASLQSWYAANISEQEETRKELTQKSMRCSEEALILSQEVDAPYYAAWAHWAATLCTLFFTEEVESALDHARQMLEQATIVKDNFLKGAASYVLAFVTNWMTNREENPDKRKKAHEAVIKYAEEAIRTLQLVAQDYFIAETYLFYVDSYSSLARDIETSPIVKRTLLEKAVDVGRQGLEHAHRSGSPDATGSTLHALSKALHFYSNLETRTDKKAMLLEEALTHRRDYIEIVRKAFPSNNWIHGVGKSYEGLIETELAKLEKETPKKIALLESATSAMEQGVSHCADWISSRPVPHFIVVVAGFQDELGRALNELYLLTHDTSNLTKATKVYEAAAEKFKTANSPSRSAESYWKTAIAHDLLGKHVEAAEHFANASAQYQAATQRVPHFVDFFLDYANYMKAWSEIEKARSAHQHEEYATAMKHYQETADLLKQSKTWSYLHPNFLAWSRLENAEDLSRVENSTEAAESFKKAAELFHEARKTLQTALNRIKRPDEKGLASRLVKASETQEEYCLGRIAIEEAKIYDRQGDHAASSKKFSSAADILQRIATRAPEPGRRELQPIISLCRAWHMMTRAEAEASPKLYVEASRLFDQAKDACFTEKAKLLALGHSRFCRALEAGMQFETTRDTKLHSMVTQHLESAADCYVRAGFKVASEYAIATQRLFDAYIYMDNASKEADPDKKARYYLVAEKVLQTSAGSYLKAKHPEKGEQVQRLLERVREERQLAAMLSEVLHAPTTTSSTSSFVSPTPNQEQAVGLERFEHAEIQANIVARNKEVRVGEDFNLDMQIVNVGKETVQLTKVEEIVPSGFEPVAELEYGQFEDGYLNIQGKKLDPMMTEEIRLVLRAFDKGTFDIKPRIVCVDEQGNQVLYEPAPITVKASEVVLPDRVATGFEDLDSMLFGGIPENYAVILTSPSCDERDLLIERFLQAGIEAGQTTFYVTAEARVARTLPHEPESNSYVFICNPRANMMIKNLPNVVKLKGVENLTDISISLTSACRRLDVSSGKLRRACIEIISDVLLQHHAVQTRRWLSSLLSDLRSKGFTTLAVMNPQMHPSEEVHAILGLFDGEITIFEKETQRGLRRFLKIRKMYNEKYLDTELPLRKERLET